MNNMLTKKILLNTVLCAVSLILLLWALYGEFNFHELTTDVIDHANWSKGLYESNQTEYASTIRAYPLFFLITGYIGGIIDSANVGIMVAGALFQVICFISIAYYINNRLVSEKMNIWLVGVFTFALCFIWPVDLNLSILRGVETPWTLYLRTFSTAPTHNLTFLAPKGLSLLIVMLFCDSLKKINYEKKLLLLSVALFITVLLKPCFYQHFVIAGTILVIFCFLKKISLDSFEYSVLMALSFIPATAWVLFSGIGMDDIHFTIMPFASILIFNESIFQAIISLISGIFFCIIVLIVSLIKKYRSLELRFAWLCFAISIVELVLLIEPNDFYSINMAWGYMSAMFILFCVSYVTMENMYLKGYIGKKITFALRAVLLWHALVGVYAYIQNGIAS